MGTIPPRGLDPGSLVLKHPRTAGSSKMCRCRQPWWQTWGNCTHGSQPTPSPLCHVPAEPPPKCHQGPRPPDAACVPSQPVRGGRRWSRCPTARRWCGPARRQSRSGHPAWSASSPSCITASYWGWGCQVRGLGQGGAAQDRGGGSIQLASSELCTLSPACALSCQQSLRSCPKPRGFGDGEESPQGWGKTTCSPQP